MAKSKPVMNINDLSPDVRNANKGTVRGLAMVEASLREVGAGRSIVVDREGRVIAGNKTLQSAADIGLEIQVVHTNGERLVVVQRDDLDLSDDTGPARKLAYLDNQASNVGLAWDAEVLLADLNAGVDFKGIFDTEELDAMLAGLVAPEPEQWTDGMGGLPTEDRQPFQQMTFTLHDTQAEQVKQAIASASKIGSFADSPNQNGNGNALSFICETFLTDYGQR